MEKNYILAADWFSGKKIFAKIFVAAFLFDFLLFWFLPLVPFYYCCSSFDIESPSWSSGLSSVSDLYTGKLASEYKVFHIDYSILTIEIPLFFILSLAIFYSIYYLYSTNNLKPAGLSIKVKRIVCLIFLASVPTLIFSVLFLIFF